MLGLYLDTLKTEHNLVNCFNAMVKMYDANNCSKKNTGVASLALFKSQILVVKF